MNIYLTLDYELFMGTQSGSVLNCLIKPMNKLVEETHNFGVLFTIFVDAAYLYKLSEHKDENEVLRRDYEEISKQLQNLVAQGHSIQLHIHPQWFYSIYKDGSWQIDQNHYKLSDIPCENLDTLFLKSKSILEEIIGKKVSAFRAGGYSLQSLSNYPGFLIENGITIDSSVASGQHYISDYQWYDYRSVLGGKVYRFNSDITKNEGNGQLVEYPISNIRISTFRYILYRLYLKWMKNIGHPFGDGRPVPSNQKIKLFKTRIMNYSFDYVMAPMLYHSFIKLKKLGHEDIVLIGHPKNQSRESIDELRKFIMKTQKIATYKTI